MLAAAAKLVALAVLAVSTSGSGACARASEGGSCAAYSDCKACTSASKGGPCAWQPPTGCQPGCVVMDVSCYEKSGSCPVEMETCALAQDCGACSEVGCVWQEGECRSECHFGPLGDFIAACYSDDYECPETALEVNEDGVRKSETASKSTKGKKKKSKKKKLAKKAIKKLCKKAKSKNKCMKKHKRKGNKKKNEKKSKTAAAMPASAQTDNLEARLSVSSTCALPLEVGPCRAAILRWGFDATRSQCVEFIYGGCRGNGNNFESQDACQAECSENV